MCGSRFVTDTESRYGVTELELLGVVWAFNKDEFVSRSRIPVELIVDHKSLISILNSKTLDQLESVRQVRLQKLQCFNYTVV